ncbi:MAG: ABC transporter substrate-binding protein/permease [Akkermansia sp.]|nr:ABC transporter substrate-binding protein/permease [Akkermansia sp.]
MSVLSRLARATAKTWKQGICALAALALLPLMTGCEEKEQTTTYVVAMEATFPPYEFYKGDEIVGIDVDILNEIGHRKGVRFKLEDMAFDSIITAVQTGKVDLVVSGLTVTEDRKRMVDFTRPYSGAKQVVIAPKNAPEYTREQLATIRVGVQHGSSGDMYVTDNICEPERFTNGALAVSAMNAGKLDAVVLDNAPAENHVAGSPDLTIQPHALVEEEYAMALRKGNTQLLNMLNAALNEMEADGTLKAIIDRHMRDNRPEEAQVADTAIGRLADDFKTDFIKNDRWKYLAEGFLVTIEIAAAAAAVGIALGFLIAVVRSTADLTGRMKVLDFFCRLYLTVVRGTPVVVQLLIIYFVIFGSVDISKVLVAIVAFGLNSAAYVAEIIRSGIMSVDRGQMEAGRSLGLGYGCTMRSIILPQAFKNVLPALGNEFIVLLKETSICGYIALQDLTKGGDIIRSQTYDAFLPLIAVALIYLALVMLLSHLLKKLELRLKKNER